MFREMRRNQNQLSLEETYKILEQCEYGFLSVIGDNDYPYVVPLNYTLLENNIYFHSAKEGHKVDAIEKNEKASFAVVLDSEVVPDKFTSKYQSAIVFGRIVTCVGEEKIQALRALIDKYAKGFIKEGYQYVEHSSDTTTVYKLIIERATSKARR